MDKARALIERLELSPHPEGGWYRETWRADGAGARAAGTAILFLLKSDEASHWHKVDAEELWFWQGGDPLELRIADSDQALAGSIMLGGDVLNGQALQGVVSTGAWQAARPARSQSTENTAGYTLVSCVVVPGFKFSGFELAPPDWEPGEK